jgi:hypothetical protein
MLASPLGTAKSVKASFEQAWPGLHWTFNSDTWSARGEDLVGKRHIEVSISNTLADLCYFIVLRATPPSVIRKTMEVLALNYVCDPEAGCLVDPYAYGDDDRYYAKKPWPPNKDGHAV